MGLSQRLKNDPSSIGTLIVELCDMVLQIQGHESDVLLPIRAYEVEKVAQHDFLKIMWTNAIPI